jgi:hypothetical protein
MKTLKVLSAIGLANLAVVAGLVFVLNSRAAPTVSPGLPPPANAVDAPAVPVGGSGTGTPAITPVPPPTSPLPEPPSIVPVPSPVTQPQPTPVTQCIVTIQGKRYDVAPLRSTHPGGDIFICGTDMTDVFFSQHDQQMLDTKMRQFLLP